MKEAYWAKELANLKLIQARDKRDETRAVVANHGEVLGGVWLAMNKDRNLRDIIPCLKIPNPQNKHRVLSFTSLSTHKNGTPTKLKHNLQLP